MPRPTVSGEEGSLLRNRVMGILLRNGEEGAAKSSWEKLVWGSKEEKGSGRRQGGSRVTSESC